MPLPFTSVSDLRPNSEMFCFALLSSFLKNSIKAIQNIVYLWKWGKKHHLLLWDTLLINTKEKSLNLWFTPDQVSGVIDPGDSQHPHLKLLMLKKFKTIHQETIQTRDDLDVCETLSLFVLQRNEDPLKRPENAKPAKVFNDVMRKFAYKCK